MSRVHRLRRRQRFAKPTGTDWPAYPMTELMDGYNEMPKEWQALLRDYGPAAQEIWDEASQVPVFTGGPTPKKITAEDARRQLERMFGRPL